MAYTGLLRVYGGTGVGGSCVFSSSGHKMGWQSGSKVTSANTSHSSTSKQSANPREGRHIENTTWNIKNCRTYMVGISQDVKRLNIWDFYPLFLGFSWPFTFELLWWKLLCVLITYRRVILCYGIADTKAQLSDFKLSKKALLVFEIWHFKNCQLKIEESLNLIAEWLQRSVYHIMA